MNPTTVVSDLATIRTALAVLVLTGRILLLLAALRRRRTTIRTSTDVHRPPGTAIERTITRVVAAAQLASAVLAVLEWLCTAGIIRL